MPERKVYESKTMALVPGWLEEKLAAAEEIRLLYSCTIVALGKGTAPGFTLPGWNTQFSSHHLGRELTVRSKGGRFMMR